MNAALVTDSDFAKVGDSAFAAIGDLYREVKELSGNNKAFDLNRVFIADSLSWLPNNIKQHLAREYSRRVKVSTNKNKIRSGNIYLRRQVERLHRIWIRYPFFRVSNSLDVIRYKKSQALTQLANTAAAKVLAVVQESGEVFAAYDVAAEVCAGWMIEPPYKQAVLKDQIEPAAECGILRMICPKWWLRKLSRLRDMCTEHLAIGAGLVGKASPYLSREALGEWRSQQQSALEWLESTLIESESGAVLPLIEAAMAGVANPSNRFFELVVRARGIEELAESSGKVGFFVTLTCPSKYHGVSTKWQENNPKEAQAYLAGQWAKIRACLGRDDITVTGLRVTEPHKDGTPHWHMLLFVKPEQVAALKAALTHYAFEVDGDEKGAEQNRLDIKSINAERGSAVAYVAKYLSKNINGEFVSGAGDLEAGSSAEDGAAMATAWASRWRIRQFQFFGCESVSVWREVRRMSDAPACVVDAKQAAERNSWADFSRALQVNPLDLAYEETQCGNEYGEMVRRLCGVQAGEALFITRSERWQLKKMDDSQRDLYKELKAKRAAAKLDGEPLPSWGALALPKRGSASWTCGNNCTESPEPLKKALAVVGISAESADYLLSGAIISPVGEPERGYKVRDGRLLEVDLARLDS